MKDLERRIIKASLWTELLLGLVVLGGFAAIILVHILDIL